MIGWIKRKVGVEFPSEQAKKHDKKNHTNNRQNSKKLSDAYVVFLSLSLVSEEVFSPLNSELCLLEPESDFMTSVNTTTTRSTPQIGTKKKMAYTGLVPESTKSEATVRNQIPIPMAPAR